MSIAPFKHNFALPQEPYESVNAYKKNARVLHKCGYKHELFHLAMIAIFVLTIGFGSCLHELNFTDRHTGLLITFTLAFLVPGILLVHYYSILPQWYQEYQAYMKDVKRFEKRAGRAYRKELDEYGKNVYNAFKTFCDENDYIILKAQPLIYEVDGLYARYPYTQKTLGTTFYLRIKVK